VTRGQSVFVLVEKRKNRPVRRLFVALRAMCSWRRTKRRRCSYAERPPSSQRVQKAAGSEKTGNKQKSREAAWTSAGLARRPLFALQLPCQRDRSSWYLLDGTRAGKRKEGEVLHPGGGGGEAAKPCVRR
jgi:hypothetical protein